MHDFGFVETIIMVSRPVLSNSYIERMPPVSSCALHEFYTIKTKKKYSPDQLTYVIRAIIHDIGYVETIIMVLRPWTISSYSYIERQPPVSSCAPDALNILKAAKFCTNSIGLSQQSHHAWYWVCRDYINDFPTLNSFFISQYKTAAPSEQQFSWRT